MTNHGKKTGVCRRSPCPVACTLDILGDKWTLLVVRDLFGGKKIYGEFLQSPEHIPTNILSDRLKRLVEHGIVVRQPYQSRPVRYEYLLTPRGRALGPVLRAMVEWGERHVEGSRAAMGPDDASVRP